MVSILVLEKVHHKTVQYCLNKESFCPPNQTQNNTQQYLHNYSSNHFFIVFNIRFALEKLENLCNEKYIKSHQSIICFVYP